MSLTILFIYKRSSSVIDRQSELRQPVKSRSAKSSDNDNVQSELEQSSADNDNLQSELEQSSADNDNLQSELEQSSADELHWILSDDNYESWKHTNPKLAAQLVYHRD